MMHKCLVALLNMELRLGKVCGYWWWIDVAAAVLYVDWTKVEIYGSATIDCCDWVEKWFNFTAYWFWIKNLY